MTLTDPREALADQSNFIGYLVGLAGVARLVHTLAADDDSHPADSHDADDFVHLLVGLASMGDAIDRITEPTLAQRYPRSASDHPGWATRRWLR